MKRAPLVLVAALAAVQAGAETALPVQIVEVQATQVSEVISLIGTVAAANSHPAAFRTGGRIVEMDVEVGDRILKDALIARIDDAQASASAEAARASLQSAEAALTQAQQARDRAISLLDRGVGTQAQLDEANEGYLTAQSARDQAEAQLARAEQSLRDTELRADEDVIVTSRAADPGEVVAAGQEVVTLAADATREAVFLAPDAAGLAALNGRQLTLLAGEGEGFAGTVTQVSPVLDDTGTVEVRATFEAGNGTDLALGTTIAGQQNITGAPLFEVPWTALTSTADGPAVWTVAEDMTVGLVPVTIAAFSDDTVRISDGLEDGARVVGAGSQDLYPGRLVKPAEMLE